jgi:beta-mannosidase
MDHHNKAEGFERLLFGYLLGNYRLKQLTLQEYSLQSQRMQADALTSAYGAWRRLWKGRGREECGGALVWQVRILITCTPSHDDLAFGAVNVERTLIDS